jgi:hypothetical protein
MLTGVKLAACPDVIVWLATSTVATRLGTTGAWPLAVPGIKGIVAPLSLALGEYALHTSPRVLVSLTTALAPLTTMSLVAVEYCFKVVLGVVLGLG